MTTDIESRERAEELYVIDGLTLEDVAKETGIPERTVQKWSADGGWKARQKEYQNAASGIRRYTRLTKLKLIKSAMTSLDPQQVYAFAALERATARNVDGEIPPGPPLGKGGEIREIATPADAVEALQEALERKLNLMLSQPGEISLKAMRDMKGAMALMDEMRKKYKGDDGNEDRLMSSEEIKELRERYL